MDITLNDIREAQKRLKPHILTTQCTYSSYLSEQCNANVFLKLENLQLTGSYKIRGALNKMLTLDKSELKNGVVASSAGNHAQGVAYAARALGVEATIVMPKNTPLSKIEGTKKLGAKVILHGTCYDDAYVRALEIHDEKELTFIHPFNDDKIIAGQGTVALEILESLPIVDILVVPVGGGGLISGILTAAKAINPKIKVYGVEATEMAAMKAACLAGEIVEVEKNKTIADGIAVRKVMDKTFEITNKFVDDIVTVNDSETARAMMKLLEAEKVLAEGAGAVSFASLLEGRIPDIEGKNVCAIVSGGNVDLNFIAKIIERGLAYDGRLAKLKIIVPDIPGSMSKVTKIIGEEEANILEITHSRNFTDTSYGEIGLNLVIESKGFEHIQEIVKTLEASYKVQVFNN